MSSSSDFKSADKSDPEMYRKVTLSCASLTLGLFLAEYLIGGHAQCPGLLFWMGVTLAICFMPEAWRAKYASYKIAMFIVIALQTFFLVGETFSVLTKVFNIQVPSTEAVPNPEPSSYPNPSITIVDQVFYIATLITYYMTSLALFFYTRNFNLANELSDPLLKK